MRRATLAIAPVLAATALATAGCGTNFDAENPNGKSPGGAQSEGLVAAQDVARVITAIRTITALCTGPKPTPQDLSSATSTLLEVYRLGPKHVVKYGSGITAVSMQTLVVTQAKRLQQCGDPQQAQRIINVAGTKTTGSPAY